MEITIGPVYSKVHENIPMVRDLMKYEDTIYLKNSFGGKHKKITVHVVTKEGAFLTGFVPKLVQNLRSSKIPVSFNVDKQAATCATYKSLESMSLHSYQKEAVCMATTKKRGVILSPTGSGKTVIGMGIIKQFKTENVLWITPTIDLLNQTYQRFVQEFEEPEIGIIGDGIFEPSRITIGIINSLHHIIQEDPQHLHKHDVIIVDECHRISKADGMYAKVLQAIPAPFRIGFTATYPPAIEGQMSLEGNIGPVIHTVSQDYLEQIGKLATPKIKIIRIPPDKSLSNYRKYTEVYDMAVVNNRIRNSIIADEIGNQVSMGNTCLVIVRILDHGENILSTLINKYPQIRAFYAHGKTEAEEREIIRQALDHRTIDVAITSTIWKEGVDIPTLNVVINAAGSKSELFCLQVIGRGMRTSPGKTDFLIIDFFDPSSHYLVNHFGHRLSIYFEKGWM